MTQIEIFHTDHLAQVQALVNTHLGTLAPGWALPDAFITSHLYHNAGEYVVDPWVIARTTLCALERQRVVAVAHLLRYGSGVEVHPSHHGAGEIAWFLAWPSAEAAAAAILAAAHGQFARWNANRVWAWNTGLPVGPCAGLPDVWPHIAAALTAAGYRRESGREEAAYGGRLDQIPAPAAPPLAGLIVRRTAGHFGTRFTALIDEQEVGYCECISDLTEGGALPALQGWAELAELEVHEPWRNRGIGTWLVQHAAEWLRLGRCDRIVLAVASGDEAAGAGRFYQRCGWQALVRLKIGWSKRINQEITQDE